MNSSDASAMINAIPTKEVENALPHFIEMVDFFLKKGSLNFNALSTVSNRNSLSPLFIHKISQWYNEFQDRIRLQILLTHWITSAAQYDPDSLGQIDLGDSVPEIILRDIQKSQNGNMGFTLLRQWISLVPFVQIQHIKSQHIGKKILRLTSPSPQFFKNQINCAKLLSLREHGEAIIHPEYISHIQNIQVWQQFIQENGTLNTLHDGEPLWRTIYLLHKTNRPLHHLIGLWIQDHIPNAEQELARLHQEEWVLRFPFSENEEKSNHVFVKKVRAIPQTSFSLTTNTGNSWLLESLFQFPSGVAHLLKNPKDTRLALEGLHSGTHGNAFACILASNEQLEPTVLQWLHTHTVQKIEQGFGTFGSILNLHNTRHQYIQRPSWMKQCNDHFVGDDNALQTCCSDPTFWIFPNEEIQNQMEKQLANNIIDHLLKNNNHDFTNYHRLIQILRMAPSNHPYLLLLGTTFDIFAMRQKNDNQLLSDHYFNRGVDCSLWTLIQYQSIQRVLRSSHPRALLTLDSNRERGLLNRYALQSPIHKARL